MCYNLKANVRYMLQQKTKYKIKCKKKKKDEVLSLNFYEQKQ